MWPDESVVPAVIVSTARLTVGKAAGPEPRPD